MVAPLFVAGSLSAQATPPSSTKPTVAAIEINPVDVFAPGEGSGFIPRALNGLHFTTRPWVVRRELLFRAGQPYDSALVAESERGLRGLRVFQSVRIDSASTDSGLVVRVRTQDAFTTLPIWGGNIISGSGSSWFLGVSELNLLGTAAQVGLRYNHDINRDAVTGSFTRARLIDSRIGVAGSYAGLSDGHIGYGVFWLPFQSLSARSSWFLSGEERQGRVLRFVEGQRDLREEFQRRYWLTKAGAGWALRASNGGYTRLGIETQLRRDDYARADRPDTLGHTVTAAIGATLQWRIARYRVATGIRGLSRTEDVDLSTVVHTGLTLTPSAFGYPNDGVVPTLDVRTGVGWRGGFVRLNGSAQGRLIKGLEVDSGSVHLGATLMHQPLPRHLVVVHGSRGWLKNPALGSEFNLGVRQGPRGFDADAFSGTNAFFLSTEYRYTVADRFLGLAGLGIAGFGDYGGAWYGGSPRRTGTSVGVGLRFGINVSTDVSPARFDVAYLSGGALTKGRWAFFAGKGFAFDLSGRLDR